MAMKRKDVICGCLLIFFGLAALIAGIVVLVLLPRLVAQRVENDIPLTEGSMTELAWSHPPYNITMQFWIFNVTNADDVMKRAAKPVLVQKGPYGFRERQQKEDVFFYPENVSVSYVNRKEYFFDPTLSCATCKESDTFTVPNIPYLIVLKKIRDDWGSRLAIDIVTALLQSVFKQYPFVSNVRVNELLFKGYDSEIFDVINKALPGAVPRRMGLFFGKNSSNDGVYKINTGVENVQDIGRILKWDNASDLYAKTWWRSNFSQANMINGTDGTIYPPFLKRTDTLRMFVHDLCRSLYITYHSDIDMKGLTAYRFTIPPEVFSVNETANRGFCWPSKELYYGKDVQPKEAGGWCLPSGMLDVSKCQRGVPMVLTSPQFVFCPEEVRRSVDGLYSGDDEFITHVDIEPTTGAVLAGARKVQLNVAMYIDPTMTNVKNMKSVIVPMVWLNESVVIDDNTFGYIYNRVVLQQRAAYIGAYVAVGLGAFCLVMLLALISYRFITEGGGKRCPCLSYGTVAEIDDHVAIVPEEAPSIG